uniref:ATP synthase subunit a n=1 Tax=Caridina sp. 1 Solomon TaxID=2493609 RepID=A0A3Q8M0Q5_9EUCA|nr:ATP synthase Fo subunit 6 [Caridina sp. 1 Solomon]
MMTNLFSSFDPLSSVLNLSLNWMSTALGFVFIPYIFWAVPSRWTVLWASIAKTLHQELKVLLGPTNSSSTIMFISLFSLIVFNNSLGLLPYVFTSTSHLAMTLALALPLWVSFMIFGWINHTKHMFAHLVPLGTPGALMPLMVLIETISNVIRPGTLAVRLAANMAAGHLLMALLGDAGPSLSTTLLSILVLSQVLLLLLESAVAMIQSYVFAVLSSLYASEVS